MLGFILSRRDFVLLSAGFMLSGLAQRLFRVSCGFLLPKMGFWKVDVWRRAGRRKKPLDFYLTNHGSNKKAITSFAPGLSRTEIDKIICAQYGVFDAKDSGIFREASSPEVNNFSERIGILAERYCPALRNFTGEMGETTALEIGTLTGGVSFELARSFQAVYGCDESKECIAIAESMKKRGWIRCRILCETGIHEEKTVTVDASIDRERISFARIDFEDVCTPTEGFNPENTFDCVVSLCLTRLEDPRMLLRRMSDFVSPNGICILGSPFDWHEDTTPRENWLGGYVGDDGSFITNMHTIRSLMEDHFTLVHVEDLPFSIRESSRQEFVMTYSVSVWRRQQKHTRIQFQ